MALPPTRPAGATLRVAIYDQDRLSVTHDPLGEVKLPLVDFLAPDVPGFDGWEDITSSPGMKTAASGKLHLRVNASSALLRGLVEYKRVLAMREASPRPRE